MCPANNLEHAGAIELADGQGACSARCVAATGADAIAVAADFDTDGMPPAVFLPTGWVAQIVLLAQLVGDACRRGIEIVRVADDLGPTAAVVGEFAERQTVNWVGAMLDVPPTGGALRIGRGPARTPATAAWRKRKGHRQASRPTSLIQRRPPERRPFAIDADRIHERLALANASARVVQCALAGRVVAIGDDHQRLLLILSLLH